MIVCVNNAFLIIINFLRMLDASVRRGERAGLREIIVKGGAVAGFSDLVQKISIISYRIVPTASLVIGNGR